MLLLFISIGWLAGIWLGSVATLPSRFLLAGWVASWTFAWLFRKKKRVLLGLALVGACCFGWVRFSTVTPVIDTHHIAFYRDYEQEVRIRGWIDQKPEEQGQVMRLSIQPDEISIEKDGERQTVNTIRGHLQISVSKYLPYFYGDEVVVEGKLSTPPVYEDFDYQEYLQRKDVFAIIKQPRVETSGKFVGNILLLWLYRFNVFTEKTVNQLVSEPESSLLAGLLLGSKRGFSDTYKQAFMTTGTTHIIALSGFNISVIVAALSILIGNRMNRKKKFWLLVAAIGLFVLFVGAAPSIMRAALMAGFMLYAQTVGRKREMTTSFLFTAALMTAWNPYTLWDVGFQLSFLSTAGILYIHPKLSKWPWFALVTEKLPNWIGETALLTLCAQIAVLPLIITYFKSISFISIISNVLILEIVPVTMLLGFLVTVTGMASLPFGRAAAMFVYYPLHYILWVIKTCAAVPFAAMTVPSLPVVVSVLYYTGLVYWLAKPKKKPVRKIISVDGVKQTRSEV
ncbi:MAG: ComEC/Rec2 family competence protein [bacterium]